MTALTAKPFTAAEAREITDRIRGAATRLHDLLLEAYARGAWKALGYDSWRDYATGELSISQSHAYRLLDQAKVIAAIAEAAGPDFSPDGEISEAAARDIKDSLPWVTESVAEKVAAGAEPAAAVRETVAEAREVKRDAAFSEAVHGPALVEDEDDPQAELLHTLEEQEQRIAHLERENASLTKDDLGAEVRRLNQVIVQMDGRLRQATTTQNAAENQAKHLTGVLQKIRAELDVQQTQQIIPAIRALRGKAAA